MCAAFDEALAYLKSVPLARKIIGVLERSATEYTVEVLNAGRPGADLKPAEFDALNNRIYWDARAGLEWRDGAFSRRVHSPAIALMHELGHAYHKEIHPREYWKRQQKQTRDQWGTAEEKRTILRIENPVAKALGEPERQFHEGLASNEARHYEASGPTTTRRARVRKPLFEALF